MKKIEVGWGFGDIYSKDKICFSGYGIANVLITVEEPITNIKEIDDIIYNRIIKILRSEIRNFTSEEIIDGSDMMIMKTVMICNKSFREENKMWVIEEIKDWSIDPPEELKQMYSKMKLKESAGVDINKIYQLQAVKEVVKDAKGPLSIDVSTNTNVHGTYVAGDIKTIHGDEIAEGSQKINIKDSVLLRSNIGGNPIKACPNCKLKIEPNWKACPRCGIKII